MKEKNAETLCSDYRRMHNLNTKIVRIFNTYGPRMRSDDGGLLATLSFKLYKAILSQFMAMVETRSFCYVDDLIEGMIN